MPKCHHIAENQRCNERDGEESAKSIHDERPTPGKDGRGGAETTAHYSRCYAIARQVVLASRLKLRNRKLTMGTLRIGHPAPVVERVNVPAPVCPRFLRKE
jgi:hypothetical protein